MKITKEQIIEILKDTLDAEERTFLGDPMCPEIIGWEAAADKILAAIDETDPTITK